MQTQIDNEELAARAKRIYDEKIKAQVEPAHIGKFVAVDAESGGWQVDEVALSAINRLNARPENVFVWRVGYRTAATIGGKMVRTSP